MEILSAKDLIVPEPQILHAKNVPTQPVDSVDKAKIIRCRDLYLLTLFLRLNPEHFFLQIPLPKDHGSSRKAGFQTGVI